MVQSPDDPFVGKTAPGFCLPDAEGTSICLETFKGKWVVLYFYPRDHLFYTCRPLRFLTGNALVHGEKKLIPASP
jgi:alkyl hydroperoxide reductase subunit AhpC